MAAPPDAVPVEVHRHQWSVIDFYVDRDRPMMRQACACGAEREIPAWDRSWQPTPAPAEVIQPL